MNRVGKGEGSLHVQRDGDGDSEGLVVATDVRSSGGVDLTTDD